jgi:hypothetical protein
VSPVSRAAHLQVSFADFELNEQNGLLMDDARQFVNFYCNPVPKHDAFHSAFIKLSPETLKAVNDLLINAAVDLGVEDGTKLCSTRGAD